MNTLFLPELREMLADGHTSELEEFCTALHPARTAEFMEGLTTEETWKVLNHTDPQTRVEIFTYFEQPQQIDIIETIERDRAAELIAEMAPDDRVDLLNDVDSIVMDELLTLLPKEDRRDILHLSSYPEETAGAVMTTEFAKLDEALTVAAALEELGRQAAELETIYYLYIVDDHDHLRGLVSARQLVAAMSKPEMKLGEIMESGLVTVDVDEDQELVAQKVDRYDLLAIPVVDAQHKILGIITHDDVIDVVREEALEDAHRSAAVSPLENGYLQTPLMTLVWKRGIWLAVLFFGALLTAKALQNYEHILNDQVFKWLVIFIPLIISSGGNTGNQSATLIITALTSRNIELNDWSRVIRREFLTGLLLGLILALMGMAAAWVMCEEARSFFGIWVMPLTILAVVISGVVCGTILPLLFQRMGLDPALMSNPFVAGIVDILGIVIYINVARTLLT